ncbi:MAG: putative DNA-binding protein [Firmicutes bacterium ADurb.Bin506]|nr:MAG: putative DNA-binding protein [Firmicutes bacterium ADurb.Bin506]
MNDLSLGEIAETHGVTRQAVHDTLLRAQRAMEGYEAHFGLMAKQAEQLASLTSLRAQLVEAREFIAKGDVKSADAAVEAAERILGDLLTDSAPGAQEDVQPAGPQMNTNTDERRVSAGV